MFAYLLAIAPSCSLAGRLSVLRLPDAISDSAVHMIGADYLIGHGMRLLAPGPRNSYGQTINAYYNSNYPSGADTLFGASANDCSP